MVSQLQTDGAVLGVPPAVHYFDLAEFLVSRLLERGDACVATPHPEALREKQRRKNARPQSCVKLFLAGSCRDEKPWSVRGLHPPPGPLPLNFTFRMRAAAPPLNEPENDPEDTARE